MHQSMDARVATVRMQTRQIAQSALRSFLGAAITAILAVGALSAPVSAASSDFKQTIGSYFIEFFEKRNDVARYTIAGVTIVIGSLLVLIGHKILRFSLMTICVIGCVLASLHLSNLVNLSGSSDSGTIKEQFEQLLHKVRNSDSYPGAVTTIAVAISVGAVIGLILGALTCCILKIGLIVLGGIGGYLFAGFILGYFNPQISSAALAGIYAGSIVLCGALSMISTAISAIVFTALGGAFIFVCGLELTSRDPSFFVNLTDGNVIGYNLDPTPDSIIVNNALYIFAGIFVLGLIVQACTYLPSRRKKIKGEF